MTDAKTDLTDKMVALSKTHARKDELLEKAEQFDVAAKGFYAEPQTVSVKSFMGAWARARRLYCECSGESLV